MAKTLQLKRDITANVASTTGAAGELIIDTTRHVITVHDGTTVGGWPTLANTSTITTAGDLRVSSNLIVAGTLTGNISASAIVGATITASDQTSFKVTNSNYPAIRPTLDIDFANSGVVDPRITIARATTATYYDGKATAMAEQNLLLQSENLLTSWTTISTTITGGQTDPLGTTTAFKLVAVSGSNEGAYNGGGVIVSGTTYSISGWFKADSATTISITGTQSAASINFSLTTTWTYFSAQLTATGGGSLWLRPSSSVPIYVWHPQLEQRSSATAYIPTTTTAITNYIPVLMTAPAGIPRLDYNPTTGQALGLLIEEQRTNLLLQSADFTATWTKPSATITANTNISPDGTLSADSLVNTSASSQHYALQNVAIAANGTYTVSVYIKALGATTVAAIWLLNAATADRAIVNFTFSTGALVVASAGGTPFTSASATATSVGNGWTRVTLTGTSTGGAINLQTRIFPNDASTFAGNDYTGIYVWGAQLEAGSFATSYIPTTSAQVTRNADQVSMTGTNFSSWYNQSQGAIIVDYLLGKGAYTGYLYDQVLRVGIESAQTQSNEIVIANATGTMYLEIGINAPAIGVNTSHFSSLTKNITGVSYGNNAFGFATNGAVVTGALTINNASLNILSLGYNISSGHIRKLSYYPKALTSANLQALTS